MESHVYMIQYFPASATLISSGLITIAIPCAHHVTERAQRGPLAASPSSPGRHTIPAHSSLHPRPPRPARPGSAAAHHVIKCARPGHRPLLVRVYGKPKVSKLDYPSAGEKDGLCLNVTVSNALKGGLSGGGGREAW